MEYNKEGALKAKQTAEKRFNKKDFTGAKKYAVKAQTLYPELEGISQMLATFDVYAASTVQIGGEIDFYSVLGLSQSVDEDTVKKQYKKLALILHPDKNKTVGADGAFKLVSEAWAVLSDGKKRVTYDLRRSRTTTGQPTYYPAQTHGVNGSSYYSKPLNPHNQPNSNTFWTICTSCKVQYEYYRKYLNNKLTCKNCRKTFLAVETGTPMNGSNQFCSWSVSPEYGHVSKVTLVPAHLPGNGVPGFHSGVTAQYQNISLQRSPVLGTCAGVVGTNGNGLVSGSAGVVDQAKVKVKVTGERVKTARKRKDRTITKNDSNCNVASSCITPSVSKAERREKKRKVDGEHLSKNGHVEMVAKTANVNTGVKIVNGDAKTGATAKTCSSNDLIRRSSMAPAFDARQLLIHKAQTEIRKKLQEMKMAAAVSAPTAAVATAAKENAVAESEVSNYKEIPTKVEEGVSVIQPEHKEEPGSISINVPDSDFHDFDRGRSEDCFKPKQIWAVYDEEDGMPRLYCLIRKVLSVRPFKILISYLHSKSNCEFGLGDLVGSGFTKSCGYFRAGNPDMIDSVNIFSHVICGGKTLRGGGVQIFPRKGDIWAVYRNWSADGIDGITPGGGKHQFEMVEVLDDYTEQLGVCVNHLAKVDGFRTVYQRQKDRSATRWIPRAEMLRFSHQVPSWSIGGETNLPDGCCDLDPAATPEELLEAKAETITDKKPVPLLEHE